jgi:hypothetical protein
VNEKSKKPVFPKLTKEIVEGFATSCLTKYYDEASQFADFHREWWDLCCSGDKFVAIGNNLQFLTDDTGNRRWLPFEVEDIDSPWEADIPYEGIYSQTYALYQDVNFRYWFTDKEIQQLRGHVQQFEVPRPEYELILTYYRKPVGLERGVYTTSSQIIGRFGNTSLRLSLQKVGRAMRELGFRQVKASNANYWVVVERTTEEVQHLLPAEAEQADPPGEKPSEENTELPF